MKAPQREILPSNNINRDKAKFPNANKNCKELENRGAEQQYRINLKHHSESIEFQNSVQKLNESIPQGNSFK